MDFNLMSVIGSVVGVLTGVIVALKVIAPKTKTTVDDAVLKRLEQVEKALEALSGGN